MAARRGRGDGSIRQRPNGLWEASLRYIDPITGLKERASFYARSRADAVDRLDEARRRLRGNQHPRDEGIRLHRFLELWLEDVVRPTRRASTYRSYKTVIEQHLAPSRLGDMLLRDLREVQIQHVLVAKAKAATRTQALSLIVLRRALDQAVKWGMLGANPAAGVQPPRRARAELRVLDRDQVRRFLDAARADRLYALYYLAIDTGMRQGELLALQWGDVDLIGGTIQVVRSMDNHTGEVGPVKTRSSKRRIEIGVAARDVLRAHSARMEAEGIQGQLVFQNTTGGALSPQNVRNRSFVPIQKAAGIDPPVRFHDLRHTAATLMLAAGANAKAVSERLGHANIAITMDFYQHVSQTMQREIADLMGSILSASPPRGRRKGGQNGGTTSRSRKGGNAKTPAKP